MVATIPVIVNAHSGARDAGDNAAAIIGAFRAHALEADIVMLQQGADIADIVQRLKATGASLVVAGGGDGTINAVAAQLLDGDITLGVLPLGTLNHFARDIGIPLALDDATRVIAEGHCIAVDVGEVNGHVFLNNSSMGLYPTIVTGRERAQKRLGLGKWPALARATLRALRDPDNFNAVVCVDGEELERRTPFIFVGNNRYVIEGFGIGKRACLDGGVLSLYVLRPKSAIGYLWLGIRALFGRSSQARDFDAVDATQFRVEAAQQRLEVATDGEVITIPTPIHYRVRPQALRVLAPPGGRTATEAHR